VSADDNLDPNPAIGCTPAAGSIFPLGLTTVNCLATDASGNTATGSFTVTLTGGTPPVIVAPRGVREEATGPAGAIVSFVVTASDAAGSVSVVCTPPSGSMFPLGITLVTCTATNSAGTSTARLKVAVVDTTPPALTAPNVTAEATSSSGAVVRYTVTVHDLVDGPSPAVTCSKPSGSRFPIGTTTVVCKATDRAGNTGWAAFKVTVQRSAPVCTAAEARPRVLWPPNHKLEKISLTGVTNADSGAVRIAIDRIFQDEPTSGLGEGDTAVDGEGVGTSTARVRAERDGSGNGRVYHIEFSATSPGGTCRGEVTIAVPTNGSNRTAFDDGPRYDSTKAPPDARNDRVTTSVGKAIVIDILGNDSNPLGHWLVVTAVSRPAHGTATIGSGRTIAYTPARGFAGTDTFTYAVSDRNGGSDTATVTVIVSEHWQGDGDDHDKRKNGHHDGDGSDHDRSERGDDDNDENRGWR
jgi:hypothetical protein